MNSEQRQRRLNYLFMKSCVERTPVVPIQKHWLDSILSGIPRSLKEGKEAHINELLEEISNDYEKSMKRFLVRSILVKPDVKGLEDEESGPLPGLPLGLDFSQPWHQSFVQARKDIRVNLHILHPTLRKILDFGYTTFSNLIIVDLSDYRSSAPLECESLKNSISLTCVKVEEKLLNTWYPRVINLFTNKENLKSIKPYKIDSFFNCVSTLMSNQLRDLLQRSVEAVVKVFDVNNRHLLPVFKMELTFDDEKMEVNPTFQDLEEVVLGIISRISMTLQNVQSWLSGSNKVQYVETKIPSHIVLEAFSLLKEAVNYNLQAPLTHYKTYVESYSWLVDGSAKTQVDTFLQEDHSFDEYTAFIEQFLQLAKDIMSLPTRAYFTMVQLDCDDLKQGLADKAKGFANILLERLVTDHRLESKKICSEFDIIKHRALMIPESSKEMFKEMAYIEDVKSKQLALLNARTTECLRRIFYLLDVYIFTPEDIVLNSAVLLWPQNINPVFDENDELIEKAKRKAELELLAKREKLMLELEKH